MDPNSLVETWDRVQKAEKLFVLKTDDNLFYVESPDDQGLTVHDVYETILRVFIDQADADLYKVIVEDYIGTKPEKMAIVGISLHQLFEGYAKINEDSKKGYSCPIKIVVCSCKPDEFPEELDTLITNTAVQN